MKTLSLLLLCVVAMPLPALELIGFELSPEVKAKWESSFPGLSFFPASEYKWKPASEVPSQMQGCWFVVYGLKDGKPEIGSAQMRVGKMSESQVEADVSAPIAYDGVEVASASDGTPLAVVFHRHDEPLTALIVRRMPDGLLLANGFYTATGKMFKNTAVFTVK